ncbi:hypothetical protein O1D97_01630 [Marinomonas sp. 15G1-11]|uniref:Uncharacterized protein n=1 Tax=Marinomonas phaeophyticola TaxID=3004091 RepID=A0ABT4JQ61_9GAMM|nr:hypothetical protein [Marinomonas sp. 15G1-11]MCZ2720375.1 hypothetical protein [Marinomonas sp. 15G1-11]
MSSLPIFITTVANSSDEPVFPVLFTWSTHDAQIKEVLVIPDDNWLAEANIESNLLNIDEGQLYDFGYEASDILTEWTKELDTDEVIALDPELTSQMIEATYDCKGLDPAFEIIGAVDWFSQRDVNLDDELQEFDLNTPIHLLPPDELIAILLQVAYKNGLIELEQDQSAE